MKAKSLVLISCMALPAIALGGCSDQRGFYGEVTLIQPVRVPNASLIAIMDPTPIGPDGSYRSYRPYRPRPHSYRTVRAETPTNDTLADGGLGGTWHVTGGVSGCYLQLGRQSSTDLSRANVMGCGGGTLAKVTAWKKAGSSVQLIRQGGETAATFAPDGKGGYASTSTSDGASLQLTR